MRPLSRFLLLLTSALLYGGELPYAHGGGALPVAHSEQDPQREGLRPAEKPKPKVATKPAAKTRPATPSPTSTPAPPQPTAAPAFRGFESVREEALRRRDGVSSANLGKVPKEWLDISYSEFQSTRFRTEKSLWRDEGEFEVQLFHPGFLYDAPVRLHLVENDQTRVFPFAKELFRYDKPRLTELPQPLPGFAGFRVHFPLHTTAYKDEFMVFLGASYFKLLGRNQQYGLSARGLALDTALPRGEEFPRFTEFWLVKPEPKSTGLTIYALLESASVVGAYEFQSVPGTTSVTDVRAVLYFRHAVEKVGLAPLTSMFLYGENSFRFFDGFRPEVHDSDGLLLHTGAKEWIWRPLENYTHLNISSFHDRNPKGFGLMQRDRRYENYQDLESMYHKRPSYWIEPTGEWGEGRVELVEIPTDSETNDNIVAYWVPDRLPPIDVPFEFSYRLSAIGQGQGVGGAGRVRSTRSSWHRTGSAPSQDPDARRFIIEFEGGDLPWTQADQPVEAIVNSSAGEVRTVTVLRNPETGGWRLFFDLVSQGANSVELRAFLRLREDVLTETWSYLWKAE